MSDIRYEFIMSQIKHIRDVKDDEKSKISFVYYEGCQGPCIFKECKKRNLSEVYQALMEVRHPNLAVVYDCVYENGNTYVVEEYIPGKTLAELLEEKGTFSEEETARIMTELCGGLEGLHHHVPPVIHNDIKTSNIMIKEDGVVKLFDFDISRTYKEGSYKNTKLMGTYEYAAPEHYGFGQSDPRTDIYSLGVTMHEMLTGMGLDHEHNVTYQGRLSKIIQKCVEIDRKKRYASATLLKADLEKFQSANGYILRTILISLCGILLLTVGGIFLNNQLEKGEKTQGTVGTQGNSSQEDESIGIEENNSEEESENIVTEEYTSEMEESTEIEGSTEVGDNNSEEDGKHEMEDDANDSSSEISPEINNSAGNGNNIQTNNDDTNNSHSIMKMVYTIQDTFLAMNAWTDGTFLLLEEISENYYLRSSDGKEKLLEGVKAARGGQLTCDPYTDKMYLLLFHYDETFIYSVTKELELELVKKMDGSSKYGVFLAFFSDGTLVFDRLHLDSNWTQIGTINIGTSPYMINDKIYSYETVRIETGESPVFLEMDKEGKVVREFSLEDEGVTLSKFDWERAIYSNSKSVYFIGDTWTSQYLYSFNGETYEIIAHVNDFEEYPAFSYTDLCVTDTACRFYRYSDKAIVEVLLE